MIKTNDTVLLSYYSVFILTWPVIGEGRIERYMLIASSLLRSYALGVYPSLQICLRIAVCL